MSDPKRAVNGDFHVIRMDGLFHVVFRPDSDPEWFRIIASFYTYERAWSYCDIERVSVWTWGDGNAESETGTEELQGLRAPPIHVDLPESPMAEPDGIPDLVRGIYDGGGHVEPHPFEDFSDHPNEDEPPKDYHDRLYQEAIAKEADKPVCAECNGPRSPGSASLCRGCYTKGKVVEPVGELTENQVAVLNFFRQNATPLKLINASYSQIARHSLVAKGSVVFLVETLERKGFIEIVEKGAKGCSSVFRLLEPITESAAHAE